MQSVGNDKFFFFHLCTWLTLFYVKLLTICQLKLLTFNVETSLINLHVTKIYVSKHKKQDELTAVSVADMKLKTMWKSTWKLKISAFCWIKDLKKGNKECGSWWSVQPSFQRSGHRPCKESGWRMKFKLICDVYILISKHSNGLHFLWM